jgi:N-glycosylase/DNA lyase
MKVLKEKCKIVIESENDFDVKQILECGQIFSFYKKEDGYIVTSVDKVAYITICEDETIIKTQDVDYFYNFFDFGTDYNKILVKIKEYYPNFDKFFVGGQNIRILHQDAFQTIISFIVSANNNITRIKKILNNISAQFGKKIENNIYSFPTIEMLKHATEEDFYLAGAGYRSKYLVKTIEMLQNERYNIDNMKKLSTDDLRARLMELFGVGEKVADCILFFGFGRSDSFPVDTWIRKAYSLFSDKPRTDKEISKYFRNIFREVSGFAQQYIFNYMLNCKQVA